MVDPLGREAVLPGRGFSTPGTGAAGSGWGSAVLGVCRGLGLGLALALYGGKGDACSDDPRRERKECKSQDDDDDDDCKQKATAWELDQAGINAHEVKKGLGQMSLFEICKCKSGGFAVKRKGCKGPIIFRL